MWWMRSSHWRIADEWVMGILHIFITLQASVVANGWIRLKNYEEWRVPTGIGLSTWGFPFWRNRSSAVWLRNVFLESYLFSRSNIYLVNRPHSCFYCTKMIFIRQPPAVVLNMIICIWIRAKSLTSKHLCTLGSAILICITWIHSSDTIRREVAYVKTSSIPIQRCLWRLMFAHIDHINALRLYDRFCLLT